jgi:hypothetical protein
MEQLEAIDLLPTYSSLDPAKPVMPLGDCEGAFRK